MAETTKIEWTDSTWSVITGCSVISSGCRRCYAMRLAGTRLRNHPSRAGLTIDTKAGPVWTGEVRWNECWQYQPLEWRKPRMIFVCAHADLFHKDVPDAWIDHVFAVASLCPQHTFQILTKRAARMREYFAVPDVGQRIYTRALSVLSDRGALTAASCPKRELLPFRNCWLGVSAEDQDNAKERMPELMLTPAWIRWVSAEPLLGAIDFTPWMDGLDWIVVGGESQHDARPTHPAWVRSIRDQCAAAQVPMLMKQWGEWLPQGCGEYGSAYYFSRAEQIAFEDGTKCAKVGKKVSGRTLDGVIHDSFPDVNR